MVEFLAYSVALSGLVLSPVYHFQWAVFKVRSHNLGKLLKAIITNGLNIAL